MSACISCSRETTSPIGLCLGCYSKNKPEQTVPAIQVWPFKNAPAQYRALSTHGGDEDWLALVPPEMADEYIGWMEAGIGSFGPCDVSEHKLPDGSIIRIGAHS